MMIPFDTWDMQSMRENNFLIKTKIDLQMTLNYEKNTTKYFALLFLAFRKRKSKF